MRRLAKASAVQPISGTGLRRCLFGIACLGVLSSVAFLGSGVPSAEGAGEACPNAAIRSEQGSTFLPDCRGYEMVSPVEKSGNQAVVSGNGNVYYSRAAASGNAIVYETSGPMGEAFRGLQFYTTGVRTPDGWTAKASIPGPEAGISLSFFNQSPNNVVIADDASRLAFVSGDTYVTENPPNPEDNSSASVAGYLTTPSGPIQWLNRPLDEAAAPRPGELTYENQTRLIGGSPDLSTLYFSYCGTITAADAPRTGHENYGFYVSENGHVSTAGVLPDGTVDPDGAIPAGGIGDLRCFLSSRTSDPTVFGNPVSEDGSQAQFVSPDPSAESSRPSELYIHRQGRPSVLVSRSQLDGAPAPTGVISVGQSYGPASTSGNYVVFASTDPLTADAPSTGWKLYRFDVRTEALVYLEGVEKGRILAVTNQGAVLAAAGEPLPTSMTLWDEGTVRQVGVFAEEARAPFHTHVAADGQVLVFTSSSPFLGEEGIRPPQTTEVYRYTIGQPGPPDCISCMPSGQTPLGSAHLSNWIEGAQVVGGLTLYDSRNVSQDGHHIFFDTPDALVPTDTNGKRDVYEWSDGNLSLITTGRSNLDSYIVDTSASGSDVFFATAQGLVPEDTDESYDVYDARVDGGFPRQEPTVCGGEACQGSLATPPRPGTAGSSALVGSGNLKPLSRDAVRARKLKKQLKACKAKRTPKQKKKCRATAHKRFGKRANAGRGH